MLLQTEVHIAIQKADHSFLLVVNASFLVIRNWLYVINVFRLIPNGRHTISAASLSLMIEVIPTI
jgi:hypothetical protein